MKHTELAAIIASPIVVVAVVVGFVLMADAGISPHCDSRVEFAPKPDITAYELAEIAANLTGYRSKEICVSNANPIPEHLVRHFR